MSRKSITPASAKPARTTGAEAKTETPVRFTEQILEAWRANNDINLLLIDAIPEAGFAAVPPGSRGRDVARQLVHMHNVRVQWIQSSGSEARGDLTLHRKEEELTREQLKDALRDSGVAVEAFLRRLLEDGRSKFFGGSPLRWMCYLISHEAHHRGQIALTLKQNGMRLPEQVAMQGLWEASWKPRK